MSDDLRSARVAHLRAAEQAYAGAADPACWISRRCTAELETRLAAVAPEAPLAGMLVAVKDNIDVAGLPTTAACPAYAYQPAADAAVVAALEDAGALCLGKTNMDQFATGLVGTRSPHGTPRNACSPEHVPGGSSSGSAVAVARGEVDIALGTDTAGSGRVPAAFNGIVGWKPTRGLLSTRGVVPAVRSLDCVSVFARDCATISRVLPVLARFDPADPFARTAPASMPMRETPPRVGVLQTDWLDRCDAPVAVAYLKSLERLARLGWRAVPVAYEPFDEAARLLYEGPVVAERSAAVGDFIRAHPEACDPSVARIITDGFRYDAVSAYRASYRLRELRRRCQGCWERCDLLLLPTTPCMPTCAAVAADPIGTNSRLGTFTNFANLLDTVAVAVPGVPRSDGLPAGLTCFGPAGTDAWLLDQAAVLQAACTA